jgi:hypothetical protein
MRLHRLVAQHEPERDLPIREAFMAIQSTTDRMLMAFGDVHGMPIGPWQGLGVAYAWALGSLVVGYALLRRRDA